MKVNPVLSMTTKGDKSESGIILEKAESNNVLIARFWRSGND